MKTSSVYVIPGIKTLDDVVAEAFGVTVMEIKSSDRKGPGKDARFFAMWYLKKYTTLSLNKIGKKYADRDHATVLHACKKVEIWKESDKIFKAKFQSAINVLEKMILN